MAGTVPSGVDIWKILPDAKAKYDEQFFQLKPVSGFITGDQAKNLFLQSGLPPQILAHIWALADRNADGKMDQYEFAIAMHLIHLKLKGFDLPKVLPPAFQSPVPPQMAVTAIRPPKAPVSIGSVRVAAPHPVMANGTPLIGQGIVAGPPVSASSSSGFIPSSSSPVDAKLQRSGSVSSQDSPTGVPPPSSLTEWAIPQQSKLKYTQLFNSYDRTRTGFLTGAQARNILMQSGLPQPVLAQIWNLCDIDADGRLSCEEFVLAMHLTDSVKAGDSLPRSLPPELIPPSFRRQRSASVQSTGSVSSHLVGEPLGEVKDEPKHGISLATFEDKRRENFEKGQAELERRRLALLESQRKEQEERQKKEREEQERRERIRQEQERRRQLELEKQLAKQREMEQEKEEQRRKALEQREAARREMERQRHLEWEKQRRQELLNQRQKEQESVCHLKNRSKNLTFELEQLTNKINELNQKIADIRKGVTDMKSSIDDMRTKRDSKLSELNTIKMQIKEMNDHVLFLNEEKIKLMTQLKDAAQNNPTAQSYNIVMHSFNNKEITLNQLRNSLSSIDKEVSEKQQDVDNSTAQLKTIKQELSDLIQSHNSLYQTYEQKRQQILEKKNKPQVSNNDSVKEIEASPTVAASGVKNDMAETKMIKYRALYAFEARNSDELSIMPGDIIMVPEGQSSEPGWLGGELHGKKGWFPEAYAEFMQSPTEVEPTDGFNSNTSINETETVHIVGTEIKRTLEGISEAPENGGEVVEIDASFGDTLQPSENSSFTQLPKCAPIDAASPIPGQGQAIVETLQAQALFPWKAKKDNHLTFNKGDVITVKEQQDMWWYGEFHDKSGWFPKSYVKLISGISSVDESHFDENEAISHPPIDDNTSMYYTATYTYESDEPGDLCFQQGEVVLVTEKKGEWWTGSIGTRSGIFPSNYVRNLEPSEEQNFKTLKKPEIVIVIAPYQATGSEQLSLQKGQLIQVRKKNPSGWWEGEMQVKGKGRQVGWFPASYVKPLGSSSSTSRSGTPDPQKLGNTAQSITQGKEQVVAVYPFTAQHDDELTFQKGQVITLINKDDASWWRGEIDGTVGLFPSNYVEPLEKS